MPFDTPRELLADSLGRSQLFLARLHDPVDRAEFLHQCNPLALADPLDFIEHGLQIPLGMKVAKVGDRKAVRLVAQTLQQL